MNHQIYIIISDDLFSKLEPADTMDNQRSDRIVVNEMIKYPSGFVGYFEIKEYSTL